MKALCAAICSGLPVVIGLLSGHLNLGLLGGVGSFSYLYVFNEPYAHRAKKIFLVAVGISFCVALGTLTAPYPILVAVIVGLIGAGATFIFGVLRIPGPAAVFFVLSFIMTTGMPVDPSAAPVRSIVVLLSGIFAWVVSIVGCFFYPHGPEIKVLKEAYYTLAEFCEAIGSPNIDDIRKRTVNALKDCEETLLIGYIPWKNSPLVNRLFLLNEQANKLFLELLEIYSNKNTELPKELSCVIRALGTRIDLRDGKIVGIELLYPEIKKDYGNLIEIICETEDIIKLPLSFVEGSVRISKPPLRMRFIKAFNNGSIVFANAVRYGAILSISTIVAYNIPLPRPYWVTLSCSAVILGANILSTLHRAIQRFLGTIIGLIIACIILKFNLQGFMIVLINMSLVVLTELFIGKNYAMAVMFITPNALLIAESSTGIDNVSYFLLVRIVHVIMGSLIGLIGIYLIGRHSALNRLPGLMSKLIRNQSQVIVCLASNVSEKIVNEKIEKMNIDVVNFNMAYNTALGEIPNNKKLIEMMWPAVFLLEQISYILDRGYELNGYLSLSQDKLAQLLIVLESMASAVEQRQAVQPIKVPIIKEIPKICKEINRLQEALSIKVV